MELAEPMQLECKVAAPSSQTSTFEWNII